MPRKSQLAISLESRIFAVRGVSVMLDDDLASLYKVDNRFLMRSVRRNASRFPGDFLFQLTNQEVAILKYQIGTSSSAGHGGRRKGFWAFTEQGVAMLSSVLKNKTAVDVNIEIMRAFVRMRRAALASQQLMPLIEDLAKRVDTHDAVIADLVHTIRQIVEGPRKSKSRPIGFTADIESAKK